MNKKEFYEHFSNEIPDHVYPDQRIYAEIWGRRIGWRLYQEQEKEITKLKEILNECHKGLNDLAFHVMDYGHTEESLAMSLAYENARNVSEKIKQYKELS